MNLLQETKQLCDLYHIKPARSKGQNFLINSDVYDKIIAEAGLHKDDLVVEVGPGLGFLTFLLADTVKTVLAVELDQKIVKALALRLEMNDYKNVRLLNADVLDFWLLTKLPQEIAKGDYQVVANLPYNISSVFLRKFLETPSRPKTMTLMLQREVAERLTARPGKMSLLSLSVQFYAEAKLVLRVDKKDFWPEPKVNSAVVKLITKKQPPLEAGELKAFWRLAKIGFSAKRKMLKNNLASGLKLDGQTIETALAKVGLKSNCRPQDLSLEEWLTLYKNLARQIII